MKAHLTTAYSTRNGDHQAKTPKKGERICQKLIFQGELCVEGYGPYSTLRLLVEGVNKKLLLCNYTH